MRLLLVRQQQGLERYSRDSGFDQNMVREIGKTINILTGSKIWVFPGKRDSPKIGHGMRDLCLHVCRECRKPSQPSGSSSQSESTRQALSGVSFQTKHPMECLVNRSWWLTVREYFVSIRCKKSACGVITYQLLTRYIASLSSSVSPAASLLL